MFGYLLVLLHCVTAQNSPMLSYQAMQELKERLAGQIVEVESLRKPSPGEDAQFIAPTFGQGVCLRLPGGQTWILVSQFLVADAQRVRARTRKAPDWVAVKVVHQIPSLGVALIQPGVLRQGCAPTLLAPGALHLRQPVAYTLDDPLGFPNIFWGILDTRAEPPLGQFLVSPVGLPMSYPLFSQQGDLLGLNLRPYVPGSKLSLAVTSLQLRRLLWSRTPWTTQRLDRRAPVPSTEP